MAVTVAAANACAAHARSARIAAGGWAVLAMLAALAVTLAAALALAAASPTEPASDPAAEPVGQAQASQPRAVGAEELKQLRQAGWPTAGPELIQFIRARNVQAVQPADLQRWINELDHPKFKVRQQASEQLRRAGRPALGLLEQAANDPRPERRVRAQQVIDELTDPDRLALDLLGLRVALAENPVEAMQLALDLLPTLRPGWELAEVQTLLRALDLRQPALLRVALARLRDPVPAVRAAVADLLGRTFDANLAERVQPLADDADSEVRTQALLALIRLQQREAVDRLIAALPQLSETQAQQADELLDHLAQGAGPTLNFRLDAPGRERLRVLWADWWQGPGQDAELSQLQELPAPSRNVLLVGLSNRVGFLREIDRTGKVRWECQGKSVVWDGQVLGRNRVLLCERRDNRVCEQTLTGDILWSYSIKMPIACRRLANGNTWIATTKEVQVVNPRGHELLRLELPNETIDMAHCAADGSFVLIERVGRCRRYDPHAKLVCDFKLDFRLILGSDRGYLLPNGHLVITNNLNSQIVEFDARGQPLVQIAVNRPVSAVKLTNGNYLIVTRDRPEHTVQEMDASGRVLWEHTFQNDLLYLAYPR